MTIAQRYRLEWGSTYAKQKGGIWQEAGLSCLVRGLTGNDNQLLVDAVTAGAVNPGDPSTTFPGLYCDEISPHVTGPKEVQVDYIFRRKSGVFRLYLGNMTDGLGYHNNAANFIWSGGSSLTQIESIVDAYGTVIGVSHTYYGTESQPPVAPGTTDTQGAAINVGSPQSTVIGKGYLQVAYPDVVSRSFIGYLNNDIWAGEPPGTWMCVDVSWEPVYTNTNPYVFEFSFTMLHDWRGHQPGVIYINPNTGKPPYNLVQGEGYKVIDWYPLKDFYPFFPIG